MSTKMMTDDLIQIYVERFICRPDTWYRQWSSTFTGEHGYLCFEPNMQHARYEYKPISAGLVRAHIEGNVTCAWPFLDVNGCSKVLAFDSDTNDGQLEELQSFLREFSWHTMCTIGRPDRDGHLYLCFDRPINASALIIFGQYMAARAGVHLQGSGKKDGLEMFPKTANGQSQLRGPLGVNLKPEAGRARDWFTQAPHEVTTQLIWLSAQPLNSAQRLESATGEIERRRLPVVRTAPITQKYLGRVQGFSPVSFEAAITRTKARHGSNGWWNAHCPLPTHKNGDKHPSLSIKSGDNGQAVVVCHRGCEPRAIYEALR
jgi:hypothetical protein